MHTHRRHPKNHHDHHMSGGHGSHGRGRGRGRGSRGRVHRGDVRSAVLRLLDEEAMHGYQIMQEIDERSDGAWQPSPGSIYPTLQQLADEGLVTSTAQGGKNIFDLTDAGRAAAAELVDTAPWQRVGSSRSRGWRELKAAMVKLAAATQLVARTGDEALVETTVGIVDDARKRIHGLLATD